MTLKLRVLVCLVLMSSITTGRAYAQSYNLFPPTTLAGGWALQCGGTSHGMMDNGGQTNGLKVTMSQAGVHPWDANLSSPPLQISDGAVYTVWFVAKADAPMKMDYDMTISNGDYHTVGLYTTAALTTEWHKYHCSFTVSKSSGYQSHFNFILGAITGAVWISSAKLVEGAPVQLSEDSSDPASWDLEVHDSDQARMIKDGDALKVATLLSDGTNWHVQLYQGGISLVEGQTYIISFDIRSDRSEDIVLNATSATTFQQAGLGATIHAATSWQHISYTFKAQNLHGELTRIPDLDIGGQRGIIWIKNATLVPTN